MSVVQLCKNKIDRIIFKKEIFVVAIVIIPIMILAAVLFAGRAELKAKIAVISESAVTFSDNDKFNIVVLDQKPALSNLMLGNYDAIVEEDRHGNYEVTTVLKSKADKETIEDFFNKGQSPDHFESQDLERGIGTKVLGIIVMIVLMQGVALTMLYPEDRTLNTFRRILTAPVSEAQYIAAQGIFTFMCLFIPTYFAIVMTKECFGIGIGFSLGMMAVLTGILTALATAFGLFMSSVLKRNISLTASLVAIITSLLGGCLVPFTVSNKVLGAILYIFPQKAFMLMIEGIEKGRGILEFKGQLIYFTIWILALWICGSLVIKRKVKQGAIN